MFYTFIFLPFEGNEINRTIFQTLVFLNRKISLTSKMFYSLDSRVLEFHRFFLTFSQMFFEIIVDTNHCNHLIRRKELEFWTLVTFKAPSVEGFVFD